MKPPYILNQTEKYYTAIHDEDTFYKIDIFIVPKVRDREIRRIPEDLYSKKSFSMQKTKNLNKCYRVYKENNVLGTKLFIKSLEIENIKDPLLRDLLEKMEKGTLEILPKKPGILYI